MSPSHARKQGIRYRYYVSSPLLQGDAGHAGSVGRVPAADVEALVGQAVREHLKGLAPAEDKDLIRTHVLRVDVQADHLVIELRAAKKEPPLRREDGTSPSSRERPAGGRPHCPSCALEETAIETAARNYRAPIRSATGRSPDPR